MFMVNEVLNKGSKIREDWKKQKGLKVSKLQDLDSILLPVKRRGARSGNKFAFDIQGSFLVKIDS
jgi:hypothetical protein